MASPPVLPLTAQHAPALLAVVNAPSPRTVLTAPAAASPAASPDPVAPHMAAAEASAEPLPPAGEAVLFLTIVGDRTYYHWGRAGDRPPRVEGMTRLGVTPADEVVEPAAGTDEPGTAAAAESASDYGGIERPYGPAPQECPRTLPPGSSQADADALRSQSGCRYLSTCSAETQDCTWYYQGRS